MEVATKSVVDAAKSRVSIRQYTDQPISEHLLNELIGLAGKAPSAWNIQPWRFVVARSQELKDKLQAASYGQPQVGSAAAVIVVTTDMKDALSKLSESAHPGLPPEKQEETKQSILGTFASMGPEATEAWGRNQGNIALGYLLLLLESYGIGSSPMLGFVPDQVREALGLAAHVEIPAIVAIGYKAADGFPQHRSPLSTILKYAD